MWLPRCFVSVNSKADHLAKQSYNIGNLKSILPNYACLAPEINIRFHGYLYQAMAALYEKDSKKNYAKTLLRLCHLKKAKI